MRFAVRMAFRELRSSARRLSLFFVAVGIGVAAIVVLRSAADSLQSALTSESRFLMAADVTVSTGEGFTGETEVIFDDVASGHPLTGVSALGADRDARALGRRPAPGRDGRTEGGGRRLPALRRP